MKMRKGFTLIELLIVLAIIAALMAVVTPIALNAVRKAKATQVAENFRNIKSAVESYVNIQQNLPSDLADIYQEGYLNSDLSDQFSLVTTGSFDTGFATVVIAYDLKDVTLEALKAVYPEILSKSDYTSETGKKLDSYFDDTKLPAASPIIVLEFQKWW